MATKTPKLCLSQDAAADELLSKDPLALLIGMVLDQQIPLEWAFQGPKLLRDRLGGSLDVREIAEMDTDQLVKVFSERPALHRFPGSNAKRVQDLCRLLVDEYGGKAADVWRTAKTGEDLYRRIKALPGFGEQKARIFLALLAKQLGVRPEGWEAQAKEYGEPGSFRSVADITSAESLAKVRAYKAEKKKAAKAAAAPAG